MRAWVALTSGSATHIKGLHVALKGPEGGRDILGAPDFEHVDVEAKPAGRRLRLSDLQHEPDDPRLPMIANRRSPGSNFAQKVEPLAGKVD